MPDIAPHVGREATLTALGQTWTASRWDLQVWDDFLAWARTALPDPMDVAIAACERTAARERALSERLADTKDKAEAKRLQGQISDLQAIQTQTMKLGMDKGSSYLAVNSPEVRSLVSSARGSAHALWLLLRKHHPDVTEEVALEIIQQAEPEAINRLWTLVQGRAPEETAKNASAPAA